MKQFHIPGVGTLTVRHILFDYNGTLAVDGVPIPGVKEKINTHGDDVQIHVITADTFGSVKKALDGVNCRVVTIKDKDERQAKADYIDTLGPETTIACGNGAIDEFMLKKAALGVAVLIEEGMSTKALMASDLLIRDVMDLFGFLENPGRLTASLRI